MARKSRKGSAASVSQTAEVKGYKTAIYVRLSKEDERKVESETVENQIAFLKEFVGRQTDMTLVETYVDRNISGTKFDRPEFNRMISDIRGGRINCVVVKDLSRLGRNYLEAGDYIEKIFPFFGTRFIAVTDNYDSLNSNPTEDGLMVPLKNLINEAYAKDISRKIHSSFDNKFREGTYFGSTAAYGYLRDPEDGHKLIVDEEVKDVVIRIFTEYVSGKSIKGIARDLNADGVVSPGVYKHEKGIRSGKFSKSSKWESSQISRLLENVVYTGDIELSKSETALYRGITKPLIKDKEDRFYVKNHHEAIISHDVFDKAQEMRKKTLEAYRGRNRKYDGIGEKKEDLFKGILYCADCGNRMGLHRKTVKIKSGYAKYNNYECRRSSVYGDADRDKYIPAANMEDVAETLIRQHISVYLDGKEKLAAANRTSAAAEKRKSLENALAKAKSRHEKIRVMMTNLYEDFADGVISEAEYLEMKSDYATEHESLEKQISSLESEYDSYCPDYTNAEGLEAAVRKYKGFEKLTAEVVSTFIRKVTCYSNDRFEFEYTFADEMEKFLELVNGREADAQ